MAEARQSVLVPYPASCMFDLVDAVELYPQFLPWCSGSEVAYRRSDELQAVVHINFHGMRQHFTTRNSRNPPHEIRMHLVEGPFSMLEGRWQFTDLGAGSKVGFELRWAFSSRVLGAMAGPVFSQIANTMVEAFVGRAQKLYG